MSEAKEMTSPSDEGADLTPLLSILCGNDEARIGILYCLLNVSTDLDISTEDAIKVMRACEKKLPKGAAIKVYWKAWIKA